MSRSTKLALVQRALKQAGRGQELQAHAKELFDDMLDNWAREFKYPRLRKVGSSLSLTGGSSTVSLPSDYGAGMDNLLFSDSKIPLQEVDGDDFIYSGGFEEDIVSRSVPDRYYVDEQAGLIRLNAAPSSAQSLIPIYFSLPVPVGDNDTVWYPDDKILVEGLVAEIYQFNGDERENDQFIKVEALKNKNLRGLIPLAGGSTRIKMARTRFRPVRGRGIRDRIW